MSQPFDMQKARTAFEKIKHKEHISTDYDVFAAATYLPPALDEIVRLRRECRECINANTYAQAKRIAELEESLQRERAMAFSKIQRQRHAITNLCKAKRERGKALVEERISGEFSDWIENQCPHWDIDVEPFCVALDGPCEYREGKCPIRNELLDRAREQLRVEGKI